MTGIKRHIPPVLFVVFLLALDQFSKYLAVVYLRPITEFQLIEGVFSLYYWENAGMAFGMLQGGRWIFVTVTIVVLGFILYYYVSLPKSRHQKLIRIFLLILTGGALGNFIDRLLKGSVVDFFYFKLIDFPIFNLADVFLVVSIFALVIITLFTKETKNE